MPSSRRKVKASEASEAVAAWRASKRSLSDWCAAEGIDGRSLGYWAGRLSTEPVAIRVVEVSGPPGAPAPPGPSLRPPRADASGARLDPGRRGPESA